MALRSRFERWSDERRLDHHHGLAVIAFQRSIQGPIQDRLWLFSFDAPPDGWEANVTAWPTGQREQSQAVEPDIELATEYGKMSARLGRMPKLLRDVMAKHYGDEGSYWAMHPRGRLVALFALTPHGSRLIAKERRGADGAQLELSDRERLANALAADAQNGSDQIRRRLINLAQREAQKLFDLATASWKETA